MRAIIRGMRGHPGTSILLWLVILGFVAGLRDGAVLRGFAGAGLMLACYGPFYLLGAHERGRRRGQT